MDERRSLAYGFVTFAFLADRLAATKTLEGIKLEGRTVSVHEAVAQKDGDKSGGTGGGASTGRTREQMMVAAAERGARKDVRDAVCPLWVRPASYSRCPPHHRHVH